MTNIQRHLTSTFGWGRTILHSLPLTARVISGLLHMYETERSPSTVVQQAAVSSNASVGANLSKSLQNLFSGAHHSALSMIR